MKKNLHSLAVLLALAALALVPVAAALAEAQSPQDPKEMTLTGQLARNEAGRFILVEETSGDSFLLESNEPQTLADNEGTKVSLTGRFSASRETFIVSKVEPAPIPPPEPRG